MIKVDSKSINRVIVYECFLPYDFLIQRLLTQEHRNDTQLSLGDFPNLEERRNCGNN